MNKVGRLASHSEWKLKDKNIITDPINILHPNTVKTSPNEHACLLAHIYPCKKKAPKQRI